MDHIFDDDDFNVLDIIIDELHDLADQGSVHEAENLAEMMRNTYELS